MKIPPLLSFVKKDMDLKNIVKAFKKMANYRQKFRNIIMSKNTAFSLPTVLPQQKTRFYY